MTAALAWRPKPPHPVLFGISYQERQSRWKTLLRFFLAIPQLIVAYILQVIFGVMSVVAWLVILFTGRYPRGLHAFSVGVLRWSTQVAAYAALLRDEYPPFSTEAGLYPVVLDIPYPEGQSRIRLFVRLITIVPNQIVFALIQIAWFFTTVYAWFAILVGGKYPPRLFGFAVGAMRWHVRQQSYLYLLRDEYPPYRLASAAPPGNELASGIIGAPLFAAYVATYILLLTGGGFGGGSERVIVHSALTSPSFTAETPSGKAGGLRITLLSYDDSAPRPLDSTAKTGYRFVAFELLAEKDGLLPTFFTPFLLRLHDCRGFGYSPDAVSEGFEFAMFWRGGDERGVVVFPLPAGGTACDLVYQQGLGKISFRFLGGR